MQKIAKASMTSYFSVLLSPLSYCHIFTISHLQMLTPSSLHLTYLYTFTFLHTHQYVLHAPYLHLLSFRHLHIFPSQLHISLYLLSLRSRAIRRLVPHFSPSSLGSKLHRLRTFEAPQLPPCLARHPRRGSRGRSCGCHAVGALQL